MSPTGISSVVLEHHPTGFGIGHARPRISWRFSAADDGSKNWTQESYEIQISRQNATEPELYHVQSRDSVLVPWPSHALQSREVAWVRVRSHGTTRDEAANVARESTEWSNPVTIETALLERSDWTARLTTSTVIPNKSEPIRPILFRKVFNSPEPSSEISSARLHITAHGVYEAFINGQRVGDEEMAPGWTSYKHRLVYRTFDVTKSILTDKPNVLGVEVAEGWFAGHLGMEEKRCFYGDRLAILAQLEVVLESGTRYTVGSDGTWNSHQSPRTRSEIYNGEDYDSNQEQMGWNSDPDLDASCWAKTEELELPSASLVATDSPPVRKMQEISPVKIFKSKSGKALLDFGQNLVGKLQVHLPAAPPSAHSEGLQISFSHAEVLERDELGTRPLRGAKPVDNVVLSEHQPKLWSPKFTFHGFRYVQLDGWPTDSGLPTRGDIEALVLYSDMTRTGWFSCSEPLVNKLHENVCWSMKGNFFSLPTDCPQRDERLGWTGDLQVFCPSASFIFDTKGFLGSWLDDVALEQMEEGRHGVPGLVVPDIFDPPNPPGPQCAWHDVTVLTPWDLYNSSGDREFLRRQYVSMKSWVDKGIMRGPNGLWDKNNWQFGDWLDPAAPPSEPGQGRTDSLIVGDAYLVRVFETISKVSVLLGEKGDAERYSKEALRVRQAFQYEYTTRSGLLVGDTQTALSLALCFGLYDEQEHMVQAASRLCHLVHTSRYRIATGFAGTPLITHTLSDTGNHQLAYRMLLEKSCPSWLYPITMGATTIWERWDSMLPDGSINPGDMTSFNHYALGSVANWLHKNVAGISPLEPGWRSIKVRPMPGGTITSANAAYESPYGRIASAWKINAGGNTFTLEIAIPPNSEAVVILPSEWKKLGDDGTERGIKIGSGKYTFSCPYIPAEWPPKTEFARSTFRLEV